MENKTNFRPPKAENIALLASPILHYTIFGVAPREIMGEKAFKKIKSQVQARADHHCEICGRFVPHTWDTKDWIHTHEAYRIDRVNKVYYLERFVGICKECHYFIHQGFLQTQLSNGIVTKEYYDYVIDRGNRILQIINKTKEENKDLSDTYVMEYEGKRYINDYFPQRAALKFLDGVRIIHYKMNKKKLPEDLYYKTPD